MSTDGVAREKNVQATFVRLSKGFQADETQSVVPQNPTVVRMNNKWLTLNRWRRLKANSLTHLTKSMFDPLQEEEEAMLSGGSKLGVYHVYLLEETVVLYLSLFLCCCCCCDASAGSIISLRFQIFIDRDPTAFAPILNFLRTKELDLR